MQKSAPIVPVRTRDQARDELRRLIICREIAPGSAIEEVSLAKSLGVSRTPVREALISLEGEGLVTSSPNRGFRAAPAEADLVIEAFPIISALEVAALTLAGPKLAAAADDLDALIDKLSNARSRAAEYKYDHAFHERLTRDCGNRRLIELLAVERNRAQRFDGHFERGTADREGACRHHREIVACIRSGKIDAAADALRRHWEWGRGIVLKWLEQRNS